MITKEQQDRLTKPCPHCEIGKLRVVAEEDDEYETVLWCNNCLVAIDESGGYLVP